MSWILSCEAVVGSQPVGADASWILCSDLCFGSRGSTFRQSHALARWSLLPRSVTTSIRVAVADKQSTLGTFLAEIPNPTPRL